jgi:hypothetical protein
MTVDKYELVEYSGLERPEYILKNGKALNIYGAKKILEQQQERITELEVALLKLIDLAGECDSWESFPSSALDDAHSVWEQK